MFQDYELAPPRIHTIFRTQTISKNTSSQKFNTSPKLQSTSKRPNSTPKKRKPIFDGYNSNRYYPQSKAQQLDFSEIPEQNIHQQIINYPSNNWVPKNHCNKIKIDGIMNPLELANLVNSIRINQFRRSSRYLS